MKALSIAQEINNRRDPAKLTESNVHQEMLAFHGLCGLSISGPRTLFKDLKLVAKAEIMIDGAVVLHRGYDNKVTCWDLSEFQQRLGEHMADYIK